MISTTTRHHFEQVLLDALRSSLPTGWDERAHMQLASSLSEVRSTHAVMLSIATYRCRLHFLLHHAQDAGVSALLGHTPGRDAHSTPLRDVLAEFGNLACGAINRELGRSWHYAGMSTPSHLTGHALDNIVLLHDQHQIHVSVTQDNALLLGVSLLIGAKAPFEFDRIPDNTEQAAGELEFF